MRREIHTKFQPETPKERDLGVDEEIMLQFFRTVFCHAIAEVIRCWIFKAESRVQSRTTSCEIHGGRSGTGVGFFSSLFSFLF
jgi:hypothetical protein